MFGYVQLNQRTGELKENVPTEYLDKAEAWENATKIAKPITERFKQMTEKEVFRSLKEGKSKEEILTQLKAKFGLYTH
jgi:hypothetical protein